MWHHLLLIIYVITSLPWQHLCQHHHYVVTADNRIKQVVHPKDQKEGCKRTVSKCPCDDMATIGIGMGKKCSNGFKHCNEYCCIRSWKKYTTKDNVTYHQEN